MGKKQKEANAANNECKQCDDEMMAIEDEIFQQHGKDLGVSSVREYEESKLKLIEERAQKTKEINAELTELANKFKFLSRKNEMNSEQNDEICARLKQINADILEIGGKKLKKIKKEIAK